MSRLAASRASPTLILAGLALAAAVAWLLPFDRIFMALTLGRPAIRAGAMVVLAIAGALMGRAVGLGIATPGGERSDLALAAGAGAAVALGCLWVDAAFRGVLDPAYVHVLTRLPLAARLGVQAMHAFGEEILYRLFLGSALALVLDRLTRGRMGETAVWAGLAAAQALNVWVNVARGAPAGPSILLYDALRFFAPGMVWGWLYARRGFQAAVVGHVAAHLVFEPLASVFLAG